MNSNQSDLITLRNIIQTFVDERDWNQFHTPKNLAMALSVEVAELVEHFQWLPTGEKAEVSEEKIVQIRHEMADVLTYLIQLADKFDINLKEAVIEKMEINRTKYPVDKVRGDSRKYSDYE